MNDKKSHLKAILDSFKTESLKIVKVYKSDFFSGIALVKNYKLAKRVENVKFIDSIESNTRKKFVKEAKILGSLNHNSIPKIYDILNNDDVLIFRTEHIKGYTLKEVMDSLNKLPISTATSNTLKLLKALNYAHSKGVFHCDIKPSNIVLKADNYKSKREFLEHIKKNKVTPYLIDFGISKFKEKSNPAEFCEGTLSYFSSMQIKNEKIDWRTDLYQLMLIYSEMISGKKPFEGLSRKEILRRKSEEGFKVRDVPIRMKKVIEKGTSIDRKRAYSCEKEAIKDLSRVNSIQKIIKYRKPVVIVFLVSILIMLSFVSFDVWDYHTQSTDALIKSLNGNTTDEKMDLILERIQRRAFEVKYYKPLIEGSFRNQATNEPLYPSHLDPNGDWVLVDSNSESAGAFVGLLFKYSALYPDILDYAVEYAEPILRAEFDGGSGKSFQYALIPAYEITKNERYLKKLNNISSMAIDLINQRKGTTLRMDIHFSELFLWIYKQTNDEHILEFIDNYMKSYIVNNIDDVGFMYEYTTVNATSPYGLVPDAKYNRLFVPSVNLQVGVYFAYEEDNIDMFKNVTSVLSRDLIQSLVVLEELYNITNNYDYKIAIEKIIKYYNSKSNDDMIDHLFVTDNFDIPKDILTTVRAVEFFQDDEKLRLLLLSDYFRAESENCVFSGNVKIKNNKYVHSDESLKNQCSMVTDAIFLNLKI